MLEKLKEFFNVDILAVISIAVDLVLLDNAIAIGLVGSYLLRAHVYVVPLPLDSSVENRVGEDSYE